MARKQFYINGTASGTFNIFVSNDTYLNAPQIDYTEYSVPARNGSLIAYNKRLNNVVRKFDCYIKTNVTNSLDALKKLLYTNPGYLTISSDYEPDTYQLGYLAQEIQVEPFNEEGDFSAQFSLYFSCMPQKFFKSNQSAETTGIAMASLRKIATSNYIGVAQTLNNVPIDVLPNSRAFYVFNLGRYSYGTTNTKTISITSTSPFVAVYSGWVSTGLQTGHGDEFDNLLAYSTSGSISWTGEFSNRTYVLIPIEYVGTLTASDGTYNINADISPVSIVSNAGALGLSMELLMRFTVAPTLTLQDYSTMVRGTLNGAQTFQSVINIDFPKLVNDLGAPTSVSQVEITIDSDNLDAYIYGGSYGERKINEYVSISGDLSGLADNVDAFPYYVASDMFALTRMEVTPRWWKV